MKKENLLNKLYILPLGLIIGITPLIVYYKKIDLGEVISSYWVRAYNTDFFSYYKMIFFLGALLISAIAFYIYLKKQQKIKKTIYYIPIAGYLLMIILSTVLSEAKLTSMTGFPDRYEGIPVLIGYCLVVIFAINLINNKNQLKFLFTILLMSAVLIGLLGIFQFYGYDFFQSSIGKKMVLSSTSYQELADKLNFRFDDNNIIYATLYNPNYAGSYFAMLFMLTFVMYIFAGNINTKILYGAINLLMFANWLGSLSRAGILGAIISLIITLCLTKRYILNNIKSVIVLFICFILVFTLMDITTGGKLRKEFLSFGDETQVVLKGKTTNINDITTEENSLIFKTDNNSLLISLSSSDKLVLKDGNNNKLKYYKEESEKNNQNRPTYIKIKDNGFDNYKLSMISHKTNGSHILRINHNGKKANFHINNNDQFKIIGMNGNLYPIKNAKSWLFENKERLASGRGYIWSRSLPLLKDTLLKGFGPDTFAIYFPQHDAVGKFKTFGSAAKIVDKPHNMYLQIAINTGVISLVAVLSLFGLYFIRSLKTYWKNDYRSWFERAGAGIFAALTAYFVAGFFNDSVISVAPVFWTLLGMGIMIELKINDNEVYNL